MSCQDEYSGEWADCWDRSTNEQVEELEAAVQKVMGEWLDRHKLRPSFWNIANPREFRVVGVMGGAIKYEETKRRKPVGV